MTSKFCRTCQRDTPHYMDKCKVCTEKENKVNLQDLEKLELIDRVRRIEAILAKFSFGI